MHLQQVRSRSVLRPVDPRGMSPEVAALLASFPAAEGGFLRLAAHSTPSLQSAAAQLREAAGMRLPPRLRHAIALRVAELNGCPSGLAPSDGAPPDAATAGRYRRGLTDDPKEQALLALATKLVLERGRHTRCAVEAARQLGAGDEEIVETVALVGLFTFANYLESVAG